MIAEDGEILPVVSLDEGEPYAVYNEEGRVLLYTFLSLIHILSQNQLVDSFWLKYKA